MERSGQQERLNTKRSIEIDGHPTGAALKMHSGMRSRKSPRHARSRCLTSSRRSTEKAPSTPIFRRCCGCSCSTTIAPKLTPANQLNAPSMKKAARSERPIRGRSSKQCDWRGRRAGIGLLAGGNPEGNRRVDYRSIEWRAPRGAYHATAICRTAIDAIEFAIEAIDGGGIERLPKDCRK